MILTPLRIGLQGMQASQEKLNTSARKVAEGFNYSDTVSISDEGSSNLNSTNTANYSAPQVNYPEEAINQIMAKMSFEANLRTVQTAQEMEERLLEIKS